jgi:hypothetical protein
VGTELTFSMSHLFLLLPGIQGLAHCGHQQQQEQRHQQVLQLLQHHGKEDMARFETNITAVLHQTSLYSVLCSMGFHFTVFWHSPEVINWSLWNSYATLVPPWQQEHTCIVDTIKIRQSLNVSHVESMKAGK